MKILLFFLILTEMRQKSMTRQSIVLLVAGNLVRRRKAAGLTQAQVAEMLSVEKESISRMESGKIVLNLERLQQFADIYGCSVTELLMDDSVDLQSQAQAVLEMLRPLCREERDAIIRFVGESVRLLKTKGS